MRKEESPPGIVRRLAAAVFCLGIFASGAGAQEFALPEPAELIAMTPAQKVAMERELTAAAADWPLSSKFEGAHNPEMSVWNPSLTGPLRGADDLHWAEGLALAFEDDFGGEVIVLRIPNGPGLHVYLVAAENPATPADVNADFVDFGPLKANSGNQNYVVRGRLGEYRTVVIYSQPFDVIFAVATLAR